MPTVRHRTSRLASILLLVALALVPLALTGHAHGDPAAARACAMCVVAHHAPAVATAAPGCAVAVVVLSRAPLPPLLPTSLAEHAPHAGRAPPFAPPTYLA